MAAAVQVTFDCGEPRALGQFWAVALGYVEQPPPQGHESWHSFLDQVGMPLEERDNFYAVVDPDGPGPRLFFQKVPEGKTAKNRVHLDVNAGGPAGTPVDARRPQVDAKAEELRGLGATVLRRAEEHGEYWIVLQDPEGNEFCLQ